MPGVLSGRVGQSGIIDEVRSSCEPQGQRSVHPHIRGEGRLAGISAGDPCFRSEVVFFGEQTESRVFLFLAVNTAADSEWVYSSHACSDYPPALFRSGMDGRVTVPARGVEQPCRRLTTDVPNYGSLATSMHAPALDF